MNYKQQYGSGICSLCLKDGKNKQSCPFELSNLELLYQSENRTGNRSNTLNKNTIKIWDQHNSTDRNGNLLTDIRNAYYESKILPKSKVNSNILKKTKKNITQNGILSKELIIISWNILHSGFIINENPYYDLRLDKETNKNIDTKNINRELRWSNILKLILSLKPHLIGLQETSLEFYKFLIKYLNKKKSNQWEILYGGTDYKKTDTFIPKNFIIPSSFNYGNWIKRKAKYGNISLINTSHISDIKLYFSPFHTNSNHNNAIISTFKYNYIHFMWINLHLSISSFKDIQLEVIKSNIEKIQKTEHINYLNSKKNIEIIFSGDFNSTNPSTLLNSVFKIKQFKTINNKLQTFCFKKHNFILDHILFLGKYIKPIKTLVGEEIDNFKCCFNPDIGKPPNNATSNNGLRVNCNQLNNELSDHKIIYSKFEVSSGELINTINQSKLLSNSIKVFNKKKIIIKNKIIKNKIIPKVSSKKTCQEVSNTRCKVYNGHMMSNCELSDKNRCIHKKFTMKKIASSKGR